VGVGYRVYYVSTSSIKLSPPMFMSPPAICRIPAVGMSCEFPGVRSMCFDVAARRRAVLLHLYRSAAGDPLSVCEGVSHWYRAYGPTGATPRLVSVLTTHHDPYKYKKAFKSLRSKENTENARFLFSNS